MNDMPDHNADQRLAEHVARTLRTAEYLPQDFEGRLLAQARAELASRGVVAPTGAPLGDHRTWWRRPTVALSPIAALALAAGFAGLVAISTVALTSRAVKRSAGVVPVVHDTIHVVRFVFSDRAARDVSLVGDFNAWERTATPLERVSDNGGWSVSVSLGAGRHEYAFLVDGKRWTTDPYAPAASDDFGTESSVVVVGSASRGDI